MSQNAAISNIEVTDGNIKMCIRDSNKGLAAACRHLEAEVWNTGYNVLV